MMVIAILLSSSLPSSERIHVAQCKVLLIGGSLVTLQTFVRADKVKKKRTQIFMFRNKKKSVKMSSSKTEKSRQRQVQKFENKSSNCTKLFKSYRFISDRIM